MKRPSFGWRMGLPITFWGCGLLAGCEKKEDAGVAISPKVQKGIPSPATSASSAPQKVTEEPVRVDLSGTRSDLSVTEVSKGPRLNVRHLRTWIYANPDAKSNKLGYLRAGASSPTAQSAVGFQGCKGGWYPIEPRGFVCVGTGATLDPQDPIFLYYEQNPPREDQRLPYRYGTVRKPGPMFTRLPKREELERAEPGVSGRIAQWLDLEGEDGAGFRQEIWEWGREVPNPREAWEAKLTNGVPPSLASGESLPSPTGRPRPSTLILDQMTSRVGHAFLDTFFFEGRRYGVTTHLELVPTDRYRPLVGSDFHGVEIGKDVDFPFAFVRRVGSKFTNGESAPYRAVLPLSGKKKFIDGRLHYETTEGNFISDQYASELRPAEKMPGWALKGEKWMSISINKQTLVLYEGQKAVYATLVSTGEAGLESPDSSTATKRGIFRVHTKHVTATMASDELGEEFELRDVPYVQYFAQGGYALHGAYWHDSFGTPKSHGCINLAPEDARRVFHWTDPPVPRGWHAAMSPLKGTVIFIHP